MRRGMKKCLAVTAVICLALLVMPRHSALASPSGLSPEAAPREASGTWTKYPSNPILSSNVPGSWDRSLWGPSVLREEGLYKMWYVGFDGTSPSSLRIGYATSPDGLQWQRHPSPVVTVGPAGSWDGDRVGWPEVIRTNGVYRMWYSGRSVGGRMCIGYATSNDGLTWRKYEANPVLTPGMSGSWDDDGVMYPTILYKDGVYLMWYEGWSLGKFNHIGYAVSSDGIHWTKNPTNPVLSPGDPSSWDHTAVMQPDVLYDASSGLFEMWYTGFSQGLEGSPNQFGYATSPNGVTWTKHAGYPVLSSGGAGAWDSADIHDPYVMWDGQVYKMWYAGVDAAGAYRIGYATASPAPPNAPPTCKDRRADVNQDGQVNLFDLVVVATAYNPVGQVSNPLADVNADGVVNLFDLVVVATNYGSTC